MVVLVDILLARTWVSRRSGQNRYVSKEGQHSMRKTLLIILALVFSTCVSYAEGTPLNEVTTDQAIQIAVAAAEAKDFDTKETVVEVLKVKKGPERGPMRMVWLVRTFPKSMSDKVLHKDFWVIYLYPKGTMEGSAHTLGGDFTAFIDLYNGSIIDTWLGM